HTDLRRPRTIRLASRVRVGRRPRRKLTGLDQRLAAVVPALDVDAAPVRRRRKSAGLAQRLAAVVQALDVDATPVRGAPAGAQQAGVERGALGLLADRTLVGGDRAVPVAGAQQVERGLSVLVPRSRPRGLVGAVEEDLAHPEHRPGVLED